ncbi:MAG: arylesterase [Burkholderiaceae bacterium]
MLSATVDAQTQTAAPPARPIVMIYGDSLSAAYGLPTSLGWATLLQKRLEAEKFPHQVVNRSLSGETSFGGLQRLPAALKRQRPAVTLLALGANDGLRGLSMAQTEKNLEQIILQLKQAGSRVVLLGIRLPPNYGPQSAKDFERLYRSLALRHNTALVPLLLAGFETNESFFQADRIHPNANAQPLMLENLWPTLRPLLGPS